MHEAATVVIILYYIYVVIIIIGTTTHKESWPPYVYVLFLFPMARQPLGGLGLLIIEASRSHSDTPHSVGLLWASDQPVAETST
jgi:hypothetical protein